MLKYLHCKYVIRVLPADKAGPCPSDSACGCDDILSWLGHGILIPQYAEAIRIPHQFVKCPLSDDATLVKDKDAVEFRHQMKAMKRGDYCLALE